MSKPKFRLPNIPPTDPPANASGEIYEAYYIPTAEELFERFPDISTDVEHTDQYRLTAWHYPKARFLKPFGGKDDARSQEIRELGNTVKSADREYRKKTRAEREALIKEAISLMTDTERKQLKPSDVLQMHMEEAFLSDDKDRAVEIATKLMEYEKPKLARKEIQHLPSDFGEATDEDINAYANDVISAEEFQLRMEGKRGGKSDIKSVK